jgi:hypothetical protein
MITLTVCTVTVLQVGGLASPVQRIMNAQALKVEESVQRLSIAASEAEKVSSRLAAFDARLGQVESRTVTLEARVDEIDRYHRFKKVIPK